MPYIDANANGSDVDANTNMDDNVEVNTPNIDAATISNISMPTPNIGAQPNTYNVVGDINIDVDTTLSSSPVRWIPPTTSSIDRDYASVKSRILDLVDAGTQSNKCACYNHVPSSSGSIRVRQGSGTGFDGFGNCPRSCDRNKKKFKSIHEELTELCPVQVSGQ